MKISPFPLLLFLLNCLIPRLIVAYEDPAKEATTCRYRCRRCALFQELDLDNLNLLSLQLNSAYCPQSIEAARMHYYTIGNVLANFCHHGLLTNLLFIRLSHISRSPVQALTTLAVRGLTAPGSSGLKLDIGCQPR